MVFQIFLHNKTICLTTIMVHCISFAESLQTALHVHDHKNDQRSQIYFDTIAVDARCPYNTWDSSVHRRPVCSCCLSYINTGHVAGSCPLALVTYR